MYGLTRRRLLMECGSTAALAAASVAAAPGGVATSGARPLRVVVVGAHPGDPEAGCGGTMARFAQQGHTVIALYLTRGEAGVSGHSAEQAAVVRSAEAAAACKILGATAQFAGQVDAATEVTRTRAAEFTRVLAAAGPDIVLTQWPVDAHPDHRACASLTLAAWNSLDRAFSLYFYEVDLGSDTQCFRPACYVDVTAVEGLKRDACMAHRSQDPEGFYTKDHVPMMRFRGMECGRKLAEAFVHHDQSPVARLPGHDAAR